MQLHDTSRWLFPCLLFLTRCISPLEAPSAFSTQTYLCDAEHAAEFDAQVESCRQDHLRDQSCAGILSFRGVFDGQPVMLDAPVVTATYTDDVVTSGAAVRIVTLNAFAPYFALRFDASNFAIPPAKTHNGPVDDDSCLASAPGQCGATEVLNLEARGGNYLSSLKSAIRNVTIETPEELRVSLRAGLARGGSIDACFHIFPKEF